jgi:phage baseplate assembly protein W
MVAIANIPSRYFQPAISGQVLGTSGLADDRFGELVTDIADIDQCIRIILTTPKGSDPLRPLFGSNGHFYIDYPIDSARPHLVREAVNALRMWEPRIEVVKVSVTVSDIAALNCAVQWQFAQGLPDDAFVTNLPIGAAQ